MEIIFISQTDVCKEITIAFFVFVLITIIILFIFKNTLRKMNTDIIKIKKISDRISLL
jgi:hypothetical protein